MQADRWIGCARRGAALAVAAIAASGAVTGSAAAATPHLRVIVPSTDVDFTRFVFGEDSFVAGDLGVYLAAEGGDVAVRTRRTGYDRPPVATVIRGALRRQVPQDLLDGMSGLARFAEVRVERADGTPIGAPTYPTVCLNGERARVRPTADAVSSFPPTGCFAGPLALGLLSGVDRGWAVRLEAAPDVQRLADGAYRVRVTLRDRTAALLGIPKAQRTLRIGIRIRTVVEGTGPGPVGSTQRSSEPSHGTPRSGSTADPELVPPRPGTVRRAPADTLPDLRALPSYGISTSVVDGRDYLDFGATTWNAGPGPLAIDGYRRRGAEEVMDSYQSFYRDGEIVAARRIGEMEFDPREGHDHWHFRDFSRYDLLDASRRRVQTSGKEAWCLAPTDAVDLLGRGAAMNPGNGDLQTACDTRSAIWVREVLASGWGDTYSQARPGQSFDITGVPNGTYLIRIVANPAGRIVERSRANNVSLRRIVLGGTARARTVQVPPVGLVDTEAIFRGDRPQGVG